MWERVKEAAQEPWGPVGRGAAVAVGIVAALFLWLGSTGERWVPVVDSANLAFHEAGHVIYGIFGEEMHWYGGTLGQLTFPVVAAAVFWFRRHTASFAVAVLWVAQNVGNIARYIGDARSQELPLAGGGEHDWTRNLGRLGLLQSDRTIDRALHILAVLVMIAVVVWMVRRAKPAATW